MQVNKQVVVMSNGGKYQNVNASRKLFALNKEFKAESNVYFTVH